MFLRWARLIVHKTSSDVVGVLVISLKCNSTKNALFRPGFEPSEGVELGVTASVLYTLYVCFRSEGEVIYVMRL